MPKILSLALLILLLRCNGKKTIATSKNENTPTENKILINEVWALTEMLGTPISDEMEKRPQLEFNSKASSFSGNNGCNQIMGNLKELTNTDVQFGMINETRMACKEMKLSSTFLSQLRETRHYKIADLNLTLTDSNGKVLLLFKKME
ncbi:MAG: hypothetical protein Mars2KO_37700 [Maribacter sp.]